MWPPHPQHRGLCIDIADPKFDAEKTFEYFFIWCCEVIGTKSAIKNIRANYNFCYLVQQWCVFDVNVIISDRESHILSKIWIDSGLTKKIKLLI